MMCIQVHDKYAEINDAVEARMRTMCQTAAVSMLRQRLTRVAKGEIGFAVANYKEKWQAEKLEPPPPPLAPG